MDNFRQIDRQRDVSSSRQSYSQLKTSPRPFVQTEREERQTASTAPACNFSIGELSIQTKPDTDDEGSSASKASVRRQNTEVESERAQGNWGRLRRIVRGSKGRARRDVIKAGVPEEHIEAAVEQTLVKRLVGSDTKQDKQWVTDERGEKVEGTEESRHKLNDLGESKYKYKSTEEAFGADYVKQHLSRFPKAHAFISQWAFNNIMKGEWPGWGRGSNFVTSLSDGDALFLEAKRGEGIATIENKLGVPEGQWSNSGTVRVIYRFIVNDPSKFNICMPNGTEGGAYQHEWVFGGKTLGGTMEAVVDSLSYQELVNSVRNGSLEIRSVSFDGNDTVEHPISL